MCGGFNVEVLENFCKNEAGVDIIDDETRDASVEREAYRDEITVSDEEYPHRDGTNDLDEEDPYRDETTISYEGVTYRDETNVPDERETYRDETTVPDERDTYRDETTVADERDTYRAETTVSHESVLNPKSDSSDSETPKKKRLFSILDIDDYFSDSEDMSQYAPILFPRKETTNNVTSSESSSDSDELEDLYGHLVFRRNERHKPNEKVDLLKIDPKSLPSRISNRVKKQSKFLTEDNIDKDILDENLKRLRSILLKSREAKLKKAEFSKHLVKEESQDYFNQIPFNGTAKKDCCIPNVQSKPCSLVLEKLNISSGSVISHNGDSKEISNIEGKINKTQMGMIKPCSIVLERLDISTAVLTSHNRDSKEISHIERKRSKKQTAKLPEIAKKLRKNVFAAKKGRYCTRSSKNHNTRSKNSI